MSQTKVLDYKRTVIPRYEREMGKLKQTNDKLKQTNIELVEKDKVLQGKLDAVRQTRDSASTARSPDEPPLPTHASFEHLDAPRKNTTFQFRFEKTNYGKGQGKAFPRKYGSNKFWDLGLCQIHFGTKFLCEVNGCGYRYHVLTDEERRYIRRLQP